MTRAFHIVAVCFGVMALTRLDAVAQTEPMVLDCAVARSVYLYSTTAGHAIYEEAINVSLTIDLALGVYAYLDDVGNSGEVKPIHSISDTLIVLQDYALSEAGVERNEHRAQLDLESWIYSFASDYRLEDGTEDVKIGSGPCLPKQPSPVG